MDCACCIPHISLNSQQSYTCFVSLRQKNCRRPRTSRNVESDRRALLRDMLGVVGECPPSSLFLAPCGGSASIKGIALGRPAQKRYRRDISYGKRPDGRPERGARWAERTDRVSSGRGDFAIMRTGLIGSYELRRPPQDSRRRKGGAVRS